MLEDRSVCLVIFHDGPRFEAPSLKGFAMSLKSLVPASQEPRKITKGRVEVDIAFSRSELVVLHETASDLAALDRVPHHALTGFGGPQRIRCIVLEPPTIVRLRSRALVRVAEPLRLLIKDKARISTYSSQITAI